MSRIGIGNNIIQPDSKCINCKYWINASKQYNLFHTAGRCRIGYCKKEMINKNKRSK